MRVDYERPQQYLCDFVLPNGIIVEAKGYFLSADRTKHKLIREQHPEHDIRFVFSDSKKRLNKGSTTTYADWCHRYGFKYADKRVPQDWLDE